MTVLAVIFLICLSVFTITGVLALVMLLSPPEWEESSHAALRKLDSGLHKAAPWFLVLMVASLVFVTILGFPLAIAALL